MCLYINLHYYDYFKYIFTNIKVEYASFKHGNINARDFVIKHF